MSRKNQNEIVFGIFAINKNENKMSFQFTCYLDVNRKFSTSATLMMSNNLNNITAPNIAPTGTNNIVNTPEIDETTERINNIKLELHKIDELNKPYESSSTSESFPWLIDKDGKFIDLSSEVTLFEGIKLISNFLEKKYNLTNLSDAKLTDLLKPIIEKDSITVRELFEHVSDLYKVNKLKEELLEPITKNSETIVDSSSKPLGEFGDITLNEVITQMKELKWDLFFNSAKLTIHAAPLVMNAVGYGLIMKGYMNTVYSRGFPESLNPQELKAAIKLRNRNLGLFSIFGAPLILICLRKTSIGLKDMSSIEINPIESKLATPNVNNNLQSSIFLILSKLKNKIPNWLKYLLNISIISILLLNLLGLNSIIEFLNNIFYLKLFAYFSCSLIILYHLLNLYFLHKFLINKNINISPILPNFIINWLNDLKVISFNNESFHYFKKDAYIQIVIYLLTIVLVYIIL